MIQLDNWKGTSSLWHFPLTSVTTVYSWENVGWNFIKGHDTKTWPRLKTVEVIKHKERGRSLNTIAVSWVRSWNKNLNKIYSWVLSSWYCTMVLYWAWPHQNTRISVSPAVSLSHQEVSISLLPFSIRGQTDWKAQSQKTNQSNHMNHSLV